MAVNHCGDVNPIAWLTENWANMIDTVMTLASNVGHEAQENTIGTISKAEAKEALRKHKGNIWASVTECVEGRQQKVSSSLIPYYRLWKFNLEFQFISNLATFLNFMFSTRSCRAKATSPGRTQ